MIRKLIKGGIFLSIGIVVAYGINWILLSNYRSLKTGDFGVWNAVIEGKVNADILISGSSRALVHFASDTISSIMENKTCYNIGLDGSPLNLQLPFLQTYLQFNRPPQIFVQELDITCLKVRKDIHNPSMYLPYLDQKYIYTNLLSLDKEFWRYKYIPLYGYALAPYYYKEIAFFKLIGRTEVEFRYDGFMPVNKSWGNEFENFKKDNPMGISYDIDPTAIENLKSIIRLAQKSGAKVILVYSPEYYENYDLTLNRGALFDVFHQIAAEFEVPFWDYSNGPLTHDKQYFYNSQHLNQKGAYTFSRLFAERLRDYLHNESDSLLANKKPD